MSMRLKANLVLFFVALAWGSSFAAQRVAGQMGGPYLFNGIRYLFGALVLAPFVWRKPLGKGQWLWMGIAGVLLFSGSAFQQVGIQYTTAANAGFITSLYVVLVPFALFVGWREKPGLLALIAVLLAVFGAYLLSTGGLSFELRFGDLLQLIGAFFWALHVVVIGKFATRYDAFQFSAGQFALNGALSLLIGLVGEEPAVISQLPWIGATAYTAVFSVVFGFTLQTWGQRHTPPTDAALLLSLESVFAAIFGWLTLNEALSVIQIMGCLLIFSGVILAQMPQATPQMASPDPAATSE